MERKEDIVDSQMEYQKLNCLAGIESTYPTTISEIPKVLLVSQESYAAATKHYVKAFSCLGSIVQTWFNFDDDTLFLYAAEFIMVPFPNSFFHITYHLLGISSMLDVENICRIRKVAVQFEEPEEEWHLEENMAYIMHIFKGATHFTIVLPCGLEEFREPVYPKMVEPISTNYAKEIYYDNYPRPDSDSEEENTPKQPADELAERIMEYISDVYENGIVFDEPPISTELIDDWRTGLMSGCVPRPMPRIEFRIMM